ncbi:transcription antitermination factor NusB [Candidatus Pseudomonas adelgestsugas]|uniref:Transcription antitermination protein NusB n=1 Tax=Candidatus Pseudomonas adelgestsugas TaxID=1302376 RepID=A0ABX5R7Y7_9PSED|nr:transcription antitermination factor NusB [Candidatus Pseudomonas adelgestsugas]QAX81668.1 hypothetical protein C3B55_00313 [Candidatus Pseudomonas adelgestsugas]
MIYDESDRFNPRDPYLTASKLSKSDKRSAARQLATQALYQRHISGASLNEIEAQFCVDNDFTYADQNYFHDILYGVHTNLTKIDTALAPCLDLHIKRLDPVELCVMRLSTWELLYCIDVPYRVIINEGIELAKVYGSTDSHKFVNGVLNNMATRLRKAEFKERKR